MLGGRDEAGIVSWVEKNTGPPAKTLANPDDYETFKAGKEVHVVGFFKNVESEKAVAYVKAADKDDSVEYAITSSDDLIKELNAKDEAIVVFKEVRQLTDADLR